MSHPSALKCQQKSLFFHVSDAIACENLIFHVRMLTSSHAKIKIPKNQNLSSHPHPRWRRRGSGHRGPNARGSGYRETMTADPAVAGLVEVDPSSIGYRAARRQPSRAEPVPEEARVDGRPLLPTTGCCGVEPVACRPTPEVPPATATSRAHRRPPYRHHHRLPRLLPASERGEKC